MPLFRLSPERRGMAASTLTRGQMDAGEGTWIPAFAGMTGGMAASTPTCGQTDAGEGTWIPAFAGKTEVMMYSVPCGNWRANGHLGGDVDSGFRRKDGGWRRLRQLAGIRTPGGDVDSGESRKDGRETPEWLVFTWRPSDSPRRAVLCAYMGAESCGPSDSYTWATRSTVSSSKALPAI